jgi:hypothetical protein
MTATLRITLLLVLLRCLTAWAACTHYASPSGNGNGLTQGTPFQIADFWGVAAPGDTLCLLAGTYTGAASMIDPPDGFSGTPAARVTIQALTDGTVTLDGQSARIPVALRGNDYFTITGVNAHHSNASVFLIQGSVGTILQRVIGWDANPNDNTYIFEVTISGTYGRSDQTLIEDCGAFGLARKPLSTYESQGPTTWRRCWARWQGTYHFGPKVAGTLAYHSSNTRLENSIGTWHRTLTDSNTAQQHAVWMAAEGTTHPFDIEILGSIAYARNTDTFTAARGFFVGTEFGPRNNITLRDNAVFFGTAYATTKRGVHFQDCPTCTGHVVENMTLVGGLAPTFPGHVSHTNVEHAATLAGVSSLFTGGTGATICRRYVDGTLTTTPLWPWPMNARIVAATTASGYGGVDVTATIESLFGPIPAACRTPVGPVQYWVTPAGSGTTCSSGSPCSLATALAAVQPGDTVLLGDGTYATPLTPPRGGTATQRLVLRATTPGAASVPSGSLTVPYLTVQGLVFDGNRAIAPVVQLHGDFLLFENNLVRESSSSLATWRGQGSIVRHNTFRDGDGSGILVGLLDPDSPEGPVDGQWYGNTVTGVGQQGGSALAVRPSTRTTTLHHNIFEAVTAGTQGCLALQGTGVTFADNWVRGSGCGIAGITPLAISSALTVRDSIFQSLTATDAIRHTAPLTVPTTATLVDGTTWCGNSGVRVCAADGSACDTPTAGLTITNNNGLAWTGGGNSNPTGAPPAACDLAIARILSEWAALPGVSTPPDPPAQFLCDTATTLDSDTVRLTLSAPVGATTVEGCTASSFATSLNGGASVAASALEQVLGVALDLTVATMAPGNTVTLTAAAGACTNLAACAALPVTNTLPPVPVQPLRAQTQSATTIALTYDGDPETLLSSCTPGDFTLTITGGAPQAASAAVPNGLVVLLTVPLMAAGDVLVLTAAAGACTGTLAGTIAVENTLAPPPAVVALSSAATVDSTTLRLCFAGAPGQSLGDTCTPAAFTTSHSGTATDAPTTSVFEDCGALTGAEWPGVLYSGHSANTVTGGVCQNPATGTRFSSQYAATVHPADQEIFVTVTDGAGTTNHKIRLFARMGDVGTAGPDGYSLEYYESSSGTDEIRLRRIDNGSETILSTTPQEIATGDRLLLRTVGDQVCAHYCPTPCAVPANWTVLDCVTDATYAASGRLGIGGDNLTSGGAATLTWDNIGGGSTSGETGAGGVATAAVETALCVDLTVPALPDAPAAITVSGLEGACSGGPTAAFTAAPVTNTLTGGESPMPTLTQTAFYSGLAGGSTEAYTRAGWGIGVAPGWSTPSRGRVRFEVCATDADSPARQWDLECSHNGGAYFRVGSGAQSLLTYGFEGATGIAPGTPTTALIHSGTFAPGGFHISQGLAFPSVGIPIAEDTCVEIPVTLQLTGGSLGDTIDCRIQGLDAYTATPRITIVAPEATR